MRPFTWLAVAVVLPSTCLADDPQALSGDWIYVADRTADRPLEKHGPPLSAKLQLRAENDAVVLLRSRTEERMAFDGTGTETTSNGTIRRTRGTWKDGTLTYVTELRQEADGSLISLIHKEYSLSPEGLLVKVTLGEEERLHGVALYQHPEDIALPTPADAELADLAWLSATWMSDSGGRSTEEWWSLAKGGAMLGVSRTVSRDRMVAFEYLRIQQRDTGLVYVAQPGGRPPTEFVLTKQETQRAVFENPRHDYPQRITYELSAEGRLNVSIGFLNGGTPRMFVLQRQQNPLRSR